MQHRGAGRKICLIYAGGTITGRRENDPRTGQDVIVQPANKVALLESLPELQRLQEYQPLSGLEYLANITNADVIFFKAIDSANVVPQDWLELAKLIFRHREKYDGFVVTHGTDTMVYTATALGLLLQGLNKPVVLTGSQLPLQGELVSDARTNLLDACRVAAQEIGEVVICFGNLVVRGCRARKVSESDWLSFTSTEVLPVATIGVTLNIDNTVAFPRGPTTLNHLDISQWEHNVCLVKLSPGMRRETMSAILLSGVKGVVIEGFGAGNIPDENAKPFYYLDIIGEAVRRGISIVLCSQAPIGRGEIFHTTVSKYLDVGVIDAFDMVPEAAVVKLMWVMGRTTVPQDIKARMQNAFIGELSGSRSASRA
jgi:L-asparaginase type I